MRHITLGHRHHLLRTYTMLVRHSWLGQFNIEKNSQPPIKESAEALSFFSQYEETLLCRALVERESSVCARMNIIWWTININDSWRDATTKSPLSLKHAHSSSRCRNKLPRVIHGLLLTTLTSRHQNFLIIATLLSSSKKSTPSAACRRNSKI